MHPTALELDGEARGRINRALAEAERRTAAEILPVVAPASGRYHRAEDFVGLWAGILLAGAAWALFQGVVEDPGSWTGRLTVRLGFLPVAILLAAGFFGGAIAAGRWPGLKRLFIPRRDLERETLERAKAVFFDRRLHRTARATGVLLYISLFERRVAILADEAVSNELSDRALDEVRDQVVAGIREHGLAAGLTRGIERLGDLLAGVLPPAAGDANEIPDEIVVLE
jgi:putative membrane protein